MHIGGVLLLKFAHKTEQKKKKEGINKDTNNSSSNEHNVNRGKRQMGDFNKLYHISHWAHLVQRPDIRDAELLGRVR